MEINNNQNQKDGVTLDGLFQEQLRNHQVAPSKRIWNNLDRKLLLRELIRFDFSNVTKTAKIVGSLAIVTISGLLIWTFWPGIEKDIEIPVERASTTVTPAIDQKEIQPAYHPPSDIRKSVVTPCPPGKITSNVQDHEGSQMLTKNETSLAAINNNPIKSSYKIHETGASTIFTLPVHPYNFLDIYQPDTLLIQTTSGTIIKINRERVVPSQFFSIGAGVAPEYLSYSLGDGKSNEFNYWFNADLTWHISRFSLQTGAGLGYLYDEGIYQMEYRSLDSVGFYYNVLSYSVDPLHPGKIIYNTVKETIWDSITHIADDRTRNRFCYLQVPLLVGITLYESRNFSFAIHAGPAVSFLIGTREAQPYIDYPKARIIRIDNNTPDRNTVNWQIWLKLEMEFRMNRSLSLRLEPYYKYYFEPIASRENINVSQPLSIGIGVGILYHFGMKK